MTTYEIVQNLAAGFTVQEIAYNRHMSIDTVKASLAVIYIIYDVENIEALICRYLHILYSIGSDCTRIISNHDILQPQGRNKLWFDNLKKKKVD